VSRAAQTKDRINQRSAILQDQLAAAIGAFSPMRWEA